MNVKIEKLVYGGDGLGHCEGATVFVPFVLPGEVVSVRPTERKKKFVRGQLQHIISAAPERAVPACPHFAACGGCHYQHVPYEAQLDHKREILRETLWRLGRVKWEGEITTLPSPPLGYRNRVQWKVRQSGERLALGYFRSGSTALLPVEHCPIASPRLEQSLAALRTLLGESRLPATLREVELFADDRDEKLLVSASCTELAGSPAAIAGTLREALPGAESILLHESSRDRFELSGPGHILYRAAGAEFRVGHLSFFQVNRHLIEEMVRAATAGAAGGTVLDLFAGVGLFSVALARSCERVIAVESNEAATRDLQANLAPAGARAEAVCADVEAFLARHTERPDLVVLDPPRAGMTPPALQHLIRLAPPQITYASCDPATLARDLAQLTGTTSSASPGAALPGAPSSSASMPAPAGHANAPGPYAIAEVHLLDVFPQTFHIESLVRLTLR